MMFILQVGNLVPFSVLRRSTPNTDYRAILSYSETPAYGHLGNTVTSLLRPLFWPPGKNRQTFSCKKNPR